MKDHTLPERLRELLEIINRLTSAGNRTLDELCRDMGYANDMARTAINALDSLSADREAGREYLLLASYCGGDSDGCTDQRPCNDCLAMCNIFDGDGAFVRELGVSDPSPPIPLNTDDISSMYAPGGTVPGRRRI